MGIGKISNANFNEAIVSTSYSGKIASLIDEKSQEIDPFAKQQQAKNMKELRKKKQEL